jgi:hypothetical protein
MRAARLLVLLCLAGLALPASAAACSCARQPEAERLRAADGAFTGTLVSRRALKDTGSSADPIVHRYRVDRRYKGRIGRTVRVRTVRSSAACGLPAQRRVALYLQRSGGRWRSNLCQMTTARAMRRAARGARSAATPEGCPA